MEFNYLDPQRLSIEIQTLKIFKSVVTGGFISTLCFLVIPTSRLVNFVMLLHVVTAVSLKSGCTVFCCTTEKVFKHIIFSDRRYEYIWFAFGCSPSSLVRLTGLTLHISQTLHILYTVAFVYYTCVHPILPPRPGLLVSFRQNHPFVDNRSLSPSLVCECVCVSMNSRKGWQKRWVAAIWKRKKLHLVLTRALWLFQGGAHDEPLRHVNALDVSSLLSLS